MGPTAGGRRPVRAGTALAAAAFTAGLVLVRGGGRPPRLRHHHLVAAMNAWTAVSRSLGVAALVLLAATLPVGLLFGRRIVGRARRADVRTMHMTLSVCALWPYRRSATALGVASAYALALLGPTYYVRRTVGARRWRIAHRFVAVGLVLAILHVAGGG